VAKETCDEDDCHLLGHGEVLATKYLKGREAPQFPHRFRQFLQGHTPNAGIGMNTTSLASKVGISPMTAVECSVDGDALGAQ